MRGARCVDAILPLCTTSSTAWFRPDLSPHRTEAVTAGDRELLGYRLFFGLFPCHDDARRIEEASSKLRTSLQASGNPVAANRLHITLQTLAEFPLTGVPIAVVRAAQIAGRNVASPEIPIVFDRAESFTKAFMLRPDEQSAATIGCLRRALGHSARRVGLRPRPSSTAHMTLTYSSRCIHQERINPIYWTATRFALVLSHIGLTHHERIEQWPLLPLGSELSWPKYE